MNVSPETRTRIESVFSRVFKDKVFTLTRETTAKDVDGWDSLTHVNLIVEIEKEFKISFTTREVIAIKNHGELEDLICKKI